MRIQAHEFICADAVGEIIVGTEESDPVLPREDRAKPET